jgi:rod shape-determining protein MreD
MGVRIDVDSPGTRLIMNFVFILVAGLLHVFILSRLLGMHETWFWVHQLIRALVNSLIGVILFALLDRLRRRE